MALNILLKEEGKRFLDDGHINLMENQPLDPRQANYKEVNNAPEKRTATSSIDIDVKADDSRSDLNE